MSRQAQLGLGAIVVLIALVLIIFFNPWTGFLRDQMADARADEETAIDGRTSFEEQVDGQADVDTAATEVRAVVQDAKENAYAVEIEARAAPGGDEPLADDVAGRLRGSDDVLCGLRPGICAGRSGSRATGLDSAR